MAIKYLKKAIKSPSTDDHETRASVQKILNDLEIRREKGIKEISKKFDKYEGEVVVSKEKIEEASKIESISITNKDKSLNIMELTGLINKASYVIANDTGPAHMAAHLGQRGIVFFGYHTTPKKVSIETDKFKALTADKLKNLSAESVYSEIKSKLELITH